MFLKLSPSLAFPFSCLSQVKVAWLLSLANCSLLVVHSWVCIRARFGRSPNIHWCTISIAVISIPLVALGYICFRQHHHYHHDQCEQMPTRKEVHFGLVARGGRRSDGLTPDCWENIQKRKSSFIWQVHQSSNLDRSSAIHSIKLANRKVPVANVSMSFWCWTRNEAAYHWQYCRAPVKLDVRVASVLGDKEQMWCRKGM